MELFARLRIFAMRLFLKNPKRCGYSAKLPVWALLSGYMRELYIDS
jgi:hypothetical protein